MPSQTFDTVEEFWGAEDLETALRLQNPGSEAAFVAALAAYVGVEAVALVPSARWALTWILNAIREADPSRPLEVAAPAFNCSAVRDAIAGAGATFLPYDFDRPGGKVDWTRVIDDFDRDGRRPAVLVVTHFFGVPTDFRKVLTTCRERGIFVVEDCAHALGGRIGDSIVGSLGDASVFSFNYDKPISLGGGGAIAVRNRDLVPREGLPSCVVPDVSQEVELLHRLVQQLRQRRRHIRRASSLWYRASQRIVRTTRPIELPDFGIGSLRAQLGVQLLERYGAVRERRNRNAELLTAGDAAFRTWHVDANVTPAWLKQKVCVGDAANAEQAARSLQRSGYRVGRYNWPRTIAENGCPNALATASQWLDVPVHQNLSERDMVHLRARLASAGKSSESKGG